ncbi:hypothetical protein HYQ45_006818 [Verticillium longisporum]|uniref:Uncharacterized protein n=1 Tax=Verticillium longisporum TaxID=100787 RepID=A0A8I2ZRP0_VERLO|nr:hypothetical protein HYQ45_006818 [Verticillium longisporum]
MAYQYPPPQVSTHAAQANMPPVGYGSDYRDGPPSSNKQHDRRVSARSCCGQAEEQAGLPSNLGGLWSLSTTEDPLYPIHI